MKTNDVRIDLHRLLREHALSMIEKAVMSGDSKASDAYIGGCMQVASKFNSIKGDVLRKAVSNLQALPGSSSLEEQSVVFICEKVAELCDALEDV